MGKITIEVKINTFGNMLYSLNHPNGIFRVTGEVSDELYCIVHYW